MRALILASGYGTRLGDLTRATPKPMIEVGGRPVIEHIMTRLNIAGIHNIIISVHYLPHIITNYIGDRALYFYEPKLHTHSEKLMLLKDWLKDEDFMVINGDTISDVSYTLMVAQHQEGTITAYMDEWRCAGTWIYSKRYFEDKNLPVIPYRQIGSVWFDTGTPERLEEARKFFS